MSENVNKAIEYLKLAKSEVSDLLSNEHSMLSISIENKLDQCINQLSVITNATPTTAAVKELYGPVTNFMGEDITKSPEPVDEPVKPELSDKEKFAERVNQFLENLPVLEPAKVIQDYVTKPDQTVVRGAAKILGLEDFKTAEFTAEFVQSIKDKQAADKEAAVQKAFEEKNLEKK